MSDDQDPVVIRDPHPETLTELNESIRRFSVYSSAQNRTWRQEDDVLPLFVDVADALDPIRQRIDAIKGWPPRIESALRVAIETFDAIAAAWGWERMGGSERKSYIKDREAWFLENVKRPAYEAALSMQAGFQGLDRYGEVDDLADEGRALGFNATMTPEEGKAQYPSTLKRWDTTPRLGTSYPKIGDKEQECLHRAYQQIDSTLNAVKRHDSGKPVVAPPEAPAPPASGNAKLDPASRAVAAAPVARAKTPRGRLDESAAIELTKDPTLTSKQLAAILGCKEGTLRDKTKCPLLAAAKAKIKAQRDIFRDQSSWRDRQSDDDES